MSNKSALKLALTNFVAQKAGGSNALVCKVQSVDAGTNTCLCIPVNGAAAVPSARLQAQTSKGFLILPKAGSLVVVEFLDDGSAYISMFSDVDEIQLDGDKFGGLTKTQELKTQLDKMNDQLQTVVDSLNNWPTTPNDGGLALQTYFSLHIIGKSAADFGQIENEKVKHGDGT